jgi:hypothetical protein
MIRKQSIYFEKSGAERPVFGIGSSVVVSAAELDSHLRPGLGQQRETLIFAPGTGATRSPSIGRLGLMDEPQLELLANSPTPPFDPEQELKTLLDSLWTPFD